MIVYRLAKAAFKNDLSGKGAEIAGGRWNSKGNAMVYSSGSRALCMLEVAVHTPLHIIPDDFWLISIEIPDAVEILELPFNKLPADWNAIPPGNSTQLTGDEFLKDGRFAVIKVPSAIVPGEFNYLINPSHKLVKKIKVIGMEKFSFDRRLFPK